MVIRGNAVNPRECKNVAKKLKRGKIPKQGLRQRKKISALRRGQKRSVQGLKKNLK